MNCLPIRWIMILAFVAALGVAGPAWAEPPQIDDTKYPDGLPRYMTDEEKALPLPRPPEGAYTLRAPPTGAIRCPAEYEPCQGLLFAWEGYTTILTEMIKLLTTLDPAAIAYVVVDTTSEQASVTSTLTSAGANMSRVQFIVRTTDSVWIRDYGPRYIFENGFKAIIDHTYNRPSRPYDNLLNDHLAAFWGQAQYDIPLTHGGGNFHLFSNGEAFMTSLIQTENPGLTAQQIKDLYRSYQNVDLTIYPGFPTSFDATQHIDMWMFPVADNKVIIGQYSVATGQPYTITENAVADFTSRGYTVYRTPGWNSGGTHYTYTNSVICNDLVLISNFGGSYTSQDATALSVYQTALPGKTIRQINCSSIITAAGALHCIVMHVPADTAALRVTPAGSFDASGPIGGPFTPTSMVYTLENTGNMPLDYNVTKNAAWLALTNASGTLPAYGTTTVTVSLTGTANTLPPGSYSDLVSFVNLTNHNGDTTRAASLTVGIPVKVYEWAMNANPGWTISGGQWAWGQPTGGGGSTGGPDPTSGYTGANVYGYNLNGDYANSIPEYHLTTTAINCSDLTRVSLKFWRWLGVERSQFDRAYVRVSNNGTSWTTIWQNPNSNIADTAWSQQSFDISAIADGRPTVYVRWTMGTTDGSVTYCGWNIDDVEIWGVQPDPCAGVSFTPGDVNGDLFVDGLDLQTFTQMVLDPGGAWTPQQRCAADADGNQVVNLDDVDEFVAGLLNP